MPRLVQTNPKRNAEFSNILFSFSFDSVERIDSRFDLLEKRRDWRIVRGGLYVVCVTSSRPVTGESKKRTSEEGNETRRLITQGDSSPLQHPPVGQLSLVIEEE